jgi:KipI family sensor histidine kinase inhibitor
MRFLAAGRQALLVELDDAEATRAAYRLILALAGTELPRPVDVVPAARTVLVDGIDPEAWRLRLDGAVARDVEAGEAGPPGDVVVPVRYDGPDLDDVAAAWRCPPAEVATRHQDVIFTVAFCGFAPGFAYCTSGGALPEVPRRSQPRTRVPSGAVGLAGEYCGVYPRQMPGGWQLIGTTELVMFDPDRDEPALLRPGTLVRFEAVR